MNISRGDIVLVNWDKGKGSEQAGIRPSLVIQNNVGNQKSPTTIIATMTQSEKQPFPFMVYIDAKDSNLGEPSGVNLAAIMTIGKTRIVKHLGQLSQRKMDEVDRAIKISLGLQ